MTSMVLLLIKGTSLNPSRWSQQGSAYFSALQLQVSQANGLISGRLSAHEGVQVKCLGIFSFKACNNFQHLEGPSYRLLVRWLLYRSFQLCQVAESFGHRAVGVGLLGAANSLGQTVRPIPNSQWFENAQLEVESGIPNTGLGYDWIWMKCFPSFLQLSKYPLGH